MVVGGVVVGRGVVVLVAVVGFGLVAAGEPGSRLLGGA
jgi:hypothetical protein